MTEVKNPSHYITSFAVADEESISAGALVMAVGEKVKEAVAGIGVKIVGVADETIYNSESTGEVIRVRINAVFGFVNDSDSPLGQEDIGGLAYILNATTVTKAPEATTAIGIVRSLDNGVVWVELVDSPTLPSLYVLEMTVKAGSSVALGDLVENDGGKAVPAVKKQNAVIVGIALTAARSGKKLYIQSGGQAVFTTTLARANIGKKAYIASRTTITVTSTGSTEVGKIMDIKSGKATIKLN